VATKEECDWYGVFCDDLGIVQQVDLHGNNMNGGLPGDFWLLNNIKRIELSTNLLSGSLPESLGTNCPFMLVFSVADNNLGGTLPASIGDWSNLTYFAVQNNAFTGTIPSSVERWSNLQIAYYDGNDFTGSVPSGF
jgi:Leucine-rich repeat (LRR) protein